MICKQILFITSLDKPELFFFCTLLNGSKYCYVTITIQHQSFVYPQLNDQTDLFSISDLFAVSLNFKNFYFECQTVM